MNATQMPMVRGPGPPGRSPVSRMRYRGWSGFTLVGRVVGHLRGRPGSWSTPAWSVVTPVVLYLDPRFHRKHHNRSILSSARLGYCVVGRRGEGE